MQAIYHVDYCELSLDKLARFVRNRPADCAINRVLADGPLWTLTDHLLDDVRMELQALRGVEPKLVKPHEQRPEGVRPPDAARARARSSARERAADRRRRIESGELI